MAVQAQMSTTKMNSMLINLYATNDPAPHHYISLKRDLASQFNSAPDKTKTAIKKVVKEFKEEEFERLKKANEDLDRKKAEEQAKKDAEWKALNPPEKDFLSVNSRNQSPGRVSICVNMKNPLVASVRKSK